MKVVNSPSKGKQKPVPQSPEECIAQYRKARREYLTRHVPAVLIGGAVIVGVMHVIMGDNFSLPTLAIIWGLIVIIPVSWSAPMKLDIRG